MSHRGPEALAGVREGQVFVGKYRIERLLGVGGIGVVVAAHHLALDEKVAIKFLLPAALSNPELVARFAREARAAAKVKSEHVARVLDVATADGGTPYIVMEYLDGVDLAGWLRERARPPVELAVDLVLQTCEALAEAHALGIVHRDLKPANLFVTRGPDGQLWIKVLDFGISKVASTGATASAAMTSTQATLGTPLYMSPEQMHSASAVDARADLWALGVISYEVLGGRLPFTGDSLPELCARVLTTAPEPLAALRPDVPEGLAAAVHRCLEKDRELRPRDVSEFAGALASFGSDEGRRSARRVAGVMQGAGGPAGKAAATPTGGARSAMVQQARPPATPATLRAVQAAVTEQGGTPQPRASLGREPAGRRRAPGAVAWAGAAGLGLVLAGGGVAGWVFVLGHRTHGDLGSTGAAGATGVSGPASATTDDLGHAPPPPSSSAPPAESLAPVEPAAATGVAASPRARPVEPSATRPRHEARPKPVTANTPGIAPSASARPAPADSATGSCHIVSTFDNEGNQHFKQVCP